jgi:hypothetical protein
MFCAPLHPCSITKKALYGLSAQGHERQMAGLGRTSGMVVIVIAVVADRGEQVLDPGLRCRCGCLFHIPSNAKKPPAVGLPAARNQIPPINLWPADHPARAIVVIREAGRHGLSTESHNSRNSTSFLSSCQGFFGKGGARPLNRCCARRNPPGLGAPIAAADQRESWRGVMPFFAQTPAAAPAAWPVTIVTCRNLQ